MWVDCNDVIVAISLSSDFSVLSLRLDGVFLVGVKQDSIPRDEGAFGHLSEGATLGREEGLLDASDDGEPMPRV